MIAIRLGALFLLAVLATAQRAPDSPKKDLNTAEPTLPVIDEKACPISNRTDGVLERILKKVKHSDQVYSSLEATRVLVGSLTVGEEVTVLSDANVIREPDKVRVLQPSRAREEPSLKSGEVVLGYALRGDGNYVFWAKGVWYTQYYEFEAGTNGGCGFADKSMCSFAILQRGVQEWWVHVKTNDGLTGWVQASRNLHGKSWSDANFDDLCRMD